MDRKHRAVSLFSLAISLLLITAGCGAGSGSDVASNDDLTSVSAVERQLIIKGKVFVSQGASSYTVKSAVQKQVRTAFGPLRIAEISVDDREFRTNVDPATFAEETIQVVRKEGEQVIPIKTIRRISYTYTARALVAKKHQSKTSIPLVLLVGDYQSFVPEIIHDCVENYEHDSEFQSSFWYVWAPEEYACKQRIEGEVTEIQAERQGLSPDQIGEKEYERRFLPVSAQLKQPSATPNTTYPEYDQLLALDDPSRDRVIVYQIVGIASHAGDPDSERYANDMKFIELFKEIKILADKWEGLRVASQSAVDPLSFAFDNKSYTGSFDDLYNWTVNHSGFPSDIASGDRDAFRRAIHDHIYRRWISLEVPLEVESSRATKQITLEIRMLYGTDSGWSVRNYFRQAFKNGHVVLYMGHSYIGSGPLDPSNYNISDFASWYQIYFFQSCVSFNYYGVDYFKLKQGGTQNLDLVTNGVESWVRDGGKTMGQFITGLFDGPPKTWLKMLELSRAQTWWGLHDPNRNVDGEQDNTFDPVTDPITIQEAGSAPQLTVTNTTAACGSTASGSVQLTATAEGATRVEFSVNGQPVASDSSAPYAASWDSTTVADGSVQLTARAVGSNGASVEDSCTVTVSNGGQGDLFFDDMEAGSAGWTASGLWHQAQSSSCVSPAFASPVTAWYFGQSSSCNYNTGSTVTGELTSPTISGISASSQLSFKYLREVESHSSGSYDETRVEVAAAGTDEWQVVWSKTCKDASAKAWKDSGALSLAAFAGQSIRVRFAFDSKDSYANDHLGWMIDDVRVTR